MRTRVPVLALLLVIAAAGPSGPTLRADTLPEAPSSSRWYPAVYTGPAPQLVASPASRAGGRVLSVLDRVRARMRETRYQHATRVRQRLGLFLWDCSGMAAWVLRRAAPGALARIGRERPVARDFYRAMERAPTDRARRGWQRIAHIRDVRPGDLFAWLRPPDWPARNTGHVGFVVEQPRPAERFRDCWTVRIVDATSVPHQDDTRPDDGRGGFGSGTIMFVTDGHGGGLGYAWYGTASRGAVATRILFGRVTR